MKKITLERSCISEEGPCYIIAEIGHNHQGNLKIALDMIKIAAQCGVDAVKFQKRDNKNLYTEKVYNKIYDNEDSFGLTYGEHREFLEFGRSEYLELKKCAQENKVEFMCTAFDFQSVDFLERLGISSYKIASGDLTNTPLLEYIARLKKPIVLSTGASTIKEIRASYETILKYHDQLCLLHTVCSYPTEYEDLNLRVIQKFKKEFPEAIIGYSGHDNGILAPVIAYLLGASVIEKHFTINHAWKGTDHKFSLEPEGLRKQVRDLRRVDICLGDGSKQLLEVERAAKDKMGKSLYAASDLPGGRIIEKEDICIKSPGGGLPPNLLHTVLGRKIKRPIGRETMILSDNLEGTYENVASNAKKIYQAD